MLQINLARTSNRGNMFLSHTTEDRLLDEWSGHDLNAMSSAAIMQSICSRLPNLGKTNRHIIYRILTELTSNISNHAYPDSFKGEKLWHISLFQCDSDSIRIEIADKGITIPKSISMKMSRISHSNEAPISQSELIRSAVTSEYCLDTYGRGQGLASIVRLIDSSHVLRVAINSGLGSWSYSASGTSVVDRDAILKGTVVSVVFDVTEELQ